MSYAAIDLNLIPPPAVVEQLDYEAILAAIKEDLLARAPDLAAVMALESDPINKVLEVCAYRELIMRARINDAARAVMLATAVGVDLEHLGALFGVQRLTLRPADDTVIPPRSSVMENDGALRRRIQLSLEGFSTAGPRGAYEFHARSASAAVADVAIASPEPGQVLVTVLAHPDTSAPDDEIVAVVAAAVNAEDTRPLCDAVSVQMATPVDFAVTAQVTLFGGPGGAVVLAAARAALDRYLADNRKIGRSISRSGLFAALHREGVARVTLTQPVADVLVGAVSYGRCTAIIITEAGAL